jgi:hypothetical protein
VLVTAYFCSFRKKRAKQYADESASDDKSLSLAYEAARDALVRQETTLTNLRTRATGILTVAALAVSFSAGLGLFATDPSKGRVLPQWATLSMLGILIATGGLVMMVLWPVKDWHFGPDARKLLRWSRRFDLDEVRRKSVKKMTEGRNYNGHHLVRRNIYFRLSVLALVAEVSVLLIGIEVA